MVEESIVKNYYQGIYLTETVMGNPNGDFVDNSPRNFDGNVFTTDKCIKYNVRRYIHEEKERLDIKDDKIENTENFVFFYPRKEGNDIAESGFLNKESILKKFMGTPKDKKELDELFKNKIINGCPDVRMFGGTFSLKKDVYESSSGKKNVNKQIYGPIQLSYGKDINNAQIKRLQIGAPFSISDGDQKTIGSEAVVDDAIISYDITINPNNYPGLLKESDLEMFKESLWYGTNLRKSTSKKTDSKLMILIKFKNGKEEGEKVTALNIGELKELIRIKNGNERNADSPVKKIEIDTTQLNQKLEKYKDFIEKIIIYRDSADVDINLVVDGLNEDQISLEEPNVLLNGD
jgi:CRISPR-associated protein Csh2